MKYYLLLNGEGEGVGIFEQQGKFGPEGDSIELADEEAEKIKQNPRHFKRVKGKLKELSAKEKETRNKKAEEFLPKRRENIKIKDLEARLELLEGKKPSVK